MCFLICQMSYFLPDIESFPLAFPSVFFFIHGNQCNLIAKTIFGILEWNEEAFIKILTDRTQKIM